MAYPDTDHPRQTAPQRRLAAEVIGTVMFAGGLLGLILCAFTYDTLLGWATLSAIAASLGLGMMFER